MKNLLKYICILFSVSAFSQVDTTDWVGYNGKGFLVTDTQLSRYGKPHPGQLILGDPEYMDDRIVLDSNYNMVSRMVNSEVGYVYNDWTSNKEKKKEELRIFNPFLKTSSLWNPLNGRLLEQEIESKTRFILVYYDTAFTPIHRVRFVNDSSFSDSICNKYQIKKHEAFKNFTPLSYKEYIFYPNGKLKAYGNLVVGYLDFSFIRYLIGEWKYFNIDNTSHTINYSELTKE